MNKKIGLVALFVVALSNVAFADPKAADGSWKWLHSTCADGKVVEPLKSLVTTMTLNLSGETGSIDSEFLPPIGSTKRVELAPLQYLDNNQLTLECSEPSKANPDTAEFCQYVGRTVDYVRDGGRLQFSYADPVNCPNSALQEAYELR